MELAEIYSDAAGETHIRRTVIDFEMRDFAPPSQPFHSHRHHCAYWRTQRHANFVSFIKVVCA